MLRHTGTCYSQQRFGTCCPTSLCPHPHLPAVNLHAKFKPDILVSIYERERVCICLNSLNIKTSSSIHFTLGARTLFFSWLNDVECQSRGFIVRSAISEHLRWFHVLAIVNNPLFSKAELSEKLANAWKTPSEILTWRTGQRLKSDINKIGPIKRGNGA